jgi:uncharacterized alpha-E superfamily protein
VFERSLVAGLWDTQHTTGVGFNLNAVFLAASCVRERLSPEHWSLIEQAQNTILQPDVTDRHDPVQAQRVLVRTSQLMAALTGAQTDRMTRDDGWRLLSIGRHIERLGFLAAALGSALDTGSVHTDGGFEALIALFDSTITFHAQYQQSRDLAALVDLLVLDGDNPRSLAWVAHTLRGRLAKLAGGAPEAPSPLASLVPKPADWRLAQLCEPGTADPANPGLTPGVAPALQTLLQSCQSAARQVSDEVSATYFTHAGDHKRSVGTP